MGYYYTRLSCVLLLAGLAFTGCATIVSGRHQEVQVISSQSGAKASTEGQFIMTPGAFTLRRDTNHVILIEKEGYISETATVTSGLGPAVAGNIIFGGLIGWGIDAASGSQYKLYPETVNVALRPIGSVSQPSAPTPAQPTTEKDSVPGQAESKKPE